MVKLTEHMDKHRLTGKSVSSVKGNCLTDCWLMVPINTQRKGIHPTFSFGFHTRLHVGTELSARASSVSSLSLLHLAVHHSPQSSQATPQEGPLFCCNHSSAASGSRRPATLPRQRNAARPTPSTSRPPCEERTPAPQPRPRRRWVTGDR